MGHDVVLWQEDSGDGTWHWFDFATGNYVQATPVYTAAPLHYNGDGVMDRMVYLGGLRRFTHTLARSSRTFRPVALPGIRMFQGGLHYHKLRSLSR